MCNFRDKPLCPIWRFRADFPEEVLFVPGKERQPSPLGDEVVEGLSRRKGEGVEYKKYNMPRI